VGGCTRRPDKNPGSPQGGAGSPRAAGIV